MKRFTTRLSGLRRAAFALLLLTSLAALAACGANSTASADTSATPV
jgi:ABC-type glycerol-3-phosphate transport system substrate-binding protein